MDGSTNFMAMVGIEFIGSRKIGGRGAHSSSRMRVTERGQMGQAINKATKNSHEDNGKSNRRKNVDLKTKKYLH